MLGPLGNLNQVTKGLAKTIRAMADGTLDSQVGARICNGLGIMRACLETQKLEQLEARMDEIADRVTRDRTNAARETACSRIDLKHLVIVLFARALVPTGLTADVRLLTSPARAGRHIGRGRLD